MSSHIVRFSTMVTDISVYGRAVDSRVADRAQLRFQVSRWGREWDTTHETVKVAIASVMETLDRLQLDHPRALGDPSISQICQRSWIDDIGVAYSESADVSVFFNDFQVMTAWILMQPNEMFRNHTIDWSLSQAVRDEISIALSVQAVRDARRKAEIFATAAGLAITGMQTLEDPYTTESEQPGLLDTTEYSAVLDDSSSEIIIAPTTITTEVRIVAHFSAEPESEHTKYTQSAQFAQAHRPGASFFDS